MPSARTIARLLTSERDCKSAEALRVRVAIETASPRIVAARNLLDRFRTMVAAKKTDDLAPWLRDAVDSELASFASGIRDDEAAVRAAIVEPWSNQVERIWRKWLSRRDRQGWVLWTRFNDFLERYPLPPVRIIHGYATVSKPLS